jgi:hypothetical protein
VVVIAGPPALVPPGRPDEAAPAAAEDWVNAMAEPPARSPAVRPDDLAVVEAPPGEVQGPPVPPAAEAGAEAGAGERSWVNAMAEPPARGPAPRPEVPAEVLAALLPADPAAVPEGVLAFAAPEGEGTALGGVSLAGLRPEGRPEGFAPEPVPDVVVLTSYDGPRPGVRPEGLAPEEPTGPDVSDALAEALAAPELTPEPEAPAEPDLQQTWRRSWTGRRTRWPGPRNSLWHRRGCRKAGPTTSAAWCRPSSTARLARRVGAAGALRAAWRGHGGPRAQRGGGSGRGRDG